MNSWSNTKPILSALVFLIALAVFTGPARANPSFSNSTPTRIDVFETCSKSSEVGANEGRVIRASYQAGLQAKRDVQKKIAQLANRLNSPIIQKQVCNNLLNANKAWLKADAEDPVRFPMNSLTLAIKQSDSFFADTKN